MRYSCSVKASAVLLVSLCAAGSIGSLRAALPPPRESAELAAQYEAVSRPQFVQGRELLSLLSIEPGDVVLDLGCGTGRLAEYTAKLVGPHGKVIGIDPSPYRIAIAKRRERSGLSFEVAGSDDLSSFASGSFDRVYLNYVFHWIENKAEALREIYRILKPGGRLGISTGLKSGQPSRVRELIRESIREVLGNVPPNLFLSPFRMTRKELRDLAERAGFRIVDLRVFPLSDYAKDPNEVIAFLSASSSGRFLSGVGDAERQRIIASLKEKLSRLETGRGIEMEHPAIFLVGEKPR
ncbi:Demethylmenaquinone methyltransferase [Methylacidimicrobium cyclopophantes]|uniref:Demethylmenaquinone methyltransferase n=1 Tax=Methylacidimicrobium cyclopophantes TaxID=1041766 RepID=A0A5E6MHW6_9BACT|nr:methyltransferase domain-containing protein [Methylacidimicrobium cyclopophantes]VVM05625.1 Demethylmenaquinone methyltransferase [Methylacidimicrobium cyclopophantes]